jgi:hypothetical protein
MTTTGIDSTGKDMSNSDETTTTMMLAKRRRGLHDVAVSEQFSLHMPRDVSHPHTNSMMAAETAIGIIPPSRCDYSCFVAS